MLTCRQLSRQKTTIVWWQNLWALAKPKTCLERRKAGQLSAKMDLSIKLGARAGTQDPTTTGSVLAFIRVCSCLGQQVLTWVWPAWTRFHFYLKWDRVCFPAGTPADLTTVSVIKINFICIALYQKQGLKVSVLPLIFLTTATIHIHTKHIFFQCFNIPPSSPQDSAGACLDVLANLATWWEHWRTVKTLLDFWLCKQYKNMSIWPPLMNLYFSSKNFKVQ